MLSNQHKQMELFNMKTTNEAVVREMTGERIQDSLIVLKCSASQKEAITALAKAMNISYLDLDL